MCLNQGTANYVNTSTDSLLYSSGEILQSIAQSLFTLMINEDTTANVYLNICAEFNARSRIFSTKFESTETGAVTQGINDS